MARETTMLACDSCGRTRTATAFEHARAWAAQLILEQRSTQILVVADSPAQNRPVNRRLESALERLDAPFRVTDPVAISSSSSDAESRASARTI